jgi:hypothetical protein
VSATVWNRDGVWLDRSYNRMPGSSTSGFLASSFSG